MILKYGRISFDILIKNGEILSINSFTKPLELNEIIESFRNPIMMEELEEVVINSRETLIILPDITRKSGAEKFLPYLINLYEKYNKEFKFIFATGTHRKLTEQEKTEILTEEIYRKYNDKIIDHDCDNMDEHFYFGKTRYNTPILINNAYLKADTIIPIGAVSYHYFAGFGGGRKLIIPGIASRKTALNNHKLVLDAEKKIKNPYATTANLKTNPVHNDIVEAIMIARRNKTFFAINTILDDSNNIIDIICGDLFMS
ncbi:MAG: lactate racemase domain-containing protein, partial [Deferribacterales bacterium]